MLTGRPGSPKALQLKARHFQTFFKTSQMFLTVVTFLLINLDQLLRIINTVLFLKLVYTVLLTRKNTHKKMQKTLVLQPNVVNYLSVSKDLS